jgi:hypothetical protein
VIIAGTNVKCVNWFGFSGHTTVSGCPAVRPETTARMTRPITSSMTAAPRIIWLSGSWRRFKSDSTRAVIPTLVAVSVAPATTATNVAKPSLQQTA